MGLEKPAGLVPVTVMVIMAFCPALTGVLGGPLTVKPSTVKLMEFVEVPPPGEELTTTTGYVPVVATSAAATDAVNCVVLFTVVVSDLPLK